MMVIGYTQCVINADAEGTMSHLYKWVNISQEDGFTIRIEIEHTHDDCTCDTSQSALKQRVIRNGLWGSLEKVA